MKATAAERFVRCSVHASVLMLLDRLSELELGDGAEMKPDDIIAARQLLVGLVGDPNFKLPPPDEEHMQRRHRFRGQWMPWLYEGQNEHVDRAFFKLLRGAGLDPETWAGGMLPRLYSPSDPPGGVAGS